MKTAKCLSQWRLDQYHMGVLPPEETHSVEAHLARCKQCNTRYQRLLHDARELQHRPDFGSLLQRGQLQLKQQSPMPSWDWSLTPSTEDEDEAQPHRPSPAQSPQEWGWQWWSFGGFSALAMAALILICQPSFSTSTPESTTPWAPPSNHVLPSPSPQTHPQPPNRVGKTRHPVFRLVHLRKGKRYSQWTQIKESLYPGDLIQFAYQLPSPSHLMILSINEQGDISTFFPFGGKQSVSMSSGLGTIPHNNSLELDDYIGQERLIMLTSPKPFSFQDVQQAIKRAFQEVGRDLSKLKTLRGPWQMQTLLIHKQHPPSKQAKAPSPKPRTP